MVKCDHLAPPQNDHEIFWQDLHVKTDSRDNSNISFWLNFKFLLYIVPTFTLTSIKTKSWNTEVKKEEEGLSKWWDAILNSGHTFCAQTNKLTILQHHKLIICLKWYCFGLGQSRIFLNDQLTTLQLREGAKTSWGGVL